MGNCTKLHLTALNCTQKYPLKHPLTMKNKRRGIYKLKGAERKSPWCWERRENGKRRRTFFESLEQALFFKQAAEEDKRKTGASTHIMFSGEEQKEYFTAKEIVEGASLIEVALFYRDHREKFALKKATIEEVIQDVCKNLNNNYTDKHKERVELWFRRFGEKFKGRDFETITKTEVANWLKGLNLAPSTIKCASEIIAFLYNRAISLGYTKERLALDKTFMPKKELKEVSVYSTEEVAAIMSYAHKTCPIWLPNLALRAFVGLRTEEASKMRWEWIDMEAKRIRIPAEICKTRDAWILQSPNLPDTVFKWLELTPREAREGPIPVPPKRLCRAIKLPLKTNGFRHTFCTMHISLFGSADKTATLLKHKGTSMLYKHYLGCLVSEEAARAYFELSPQSNGLVASR